VVVRNVEASPKYYEELTAIRLNSSIKPVDAAEAIACPG
jgi:hypothetical protein